MARNSEKAMSTLHRWRQLQASEAEGGIKGKPKRRPYLAELCQDLKEAEKWRREIISEISNLVQLIQNEGLEECKIRDMNDHINKLFREKKHWERRIIDLGGSNYIRTVSTKSEDDDVLGTRNYKYFGAAKNLPGVRELFAAPDKGPARKTKAELLKFVNCDYFGFRDEDDGVILPLEAAAEEEARRTSTVASWSERAASHE